MILRRYGSSYQSVDMDFDAKALNEFAFRRNRQESIPADDFEASFGTVQRVELSESAEGPVQYEALQSMLDKVREGVEDVVARLEAGQVLVIDNEQGHDYPKPRQHTRNVIEEGENRLHFEYTMHPPLRVSVWQPAG